MCLAVPGKIVEIQNEIAIVDYDVEKRKARIIDSTFRKGDYVIVQGGIAVQKIPKKEAVSALELFKKSFAD